MRVQAPSRIFQILCTLHFGIFVTRHQFDRPHAHDRMRAFLIGRSISMAENQNTTAAMTAQNEA